MGLNLASLSTITIDVNSCACMKSPARVVIVSGPVRSGKEALNIRKEEILVRCWMLTLVVTAAQGKHDDDDVGINVDIE